MTLLGLQKAAAKTNKAQEIEGELLVVPFHSITKSVNPRREPAKLARLGFSLIDDGDKVHSLAHLALSDDMTKVREFVDLIESHEHSDAFGDDSEVSDDLSGVDDKEPKVKRASIIALAQSIATTVQLQPVAVRRGGKRKDEGHNYTLIFGQRRFAAMLYAYAKGRIAAEEGVTSIFSGFHPTLKATVVSVSEDEAFEMAVRENMDRKDFNPIQEGEVYYAMTQRINPATGKKWNLKDVARHYDQQYATVRNRCALAVPYVEDKLDAEGNVVKKGRGLTEEERDQILTGKKNVTWGSRRSLREEHYSDGTPAVKRRKAIPLAKMEELFDLTSASETDIVSQARRLAIAECMGLTMKKATQESVRRIKKAEKAARQAA